MRVADTDDADIIELGPTLCHAKAMKPRVFAIQRRSLGCCQKKAAPKTFRGDLRETACDYFRRAGNARAERQLRQARRCASTEANKSCPASELERFRCCRS